MNTTVAQFCWCLSFTRSVYWFQYLSSRKYSSPSSPKNRYFVLLCDLFARLLTKWQLFLHLSWQETFGRNKWTHESKIWFSWQKPFPKNWFWSVSSTSSSLKSCDQLSSHQTFLLCCLFWMDYPSVFMELESLYYLPWQTMVKMLLIVLIGMLLCLQTKWLMITWNQRLWFLRVSCWWWSKSFCYWSRSFWSWWGIISPTGESLPKSTFLLREVWSWSIIHEDLHSTFWEYTLPRTLSSTHTMYLNWVTLKDRDYWRIWRHFLFTSSFWRQSFCWLITCSWFSLQPAKQTQWCYPYRS